jgi:hypothetical protein
VFLVSGTAIQHTERQRPNALLNAPVPSITEVKKQHRPQSVHTGHSYKKDRLALLLARCHVVSQWHRDELI